MTDIEAIYARLPSIACAGKCWEACGPIICTEAEREKLEKATHRKLSHRTDGTCTMLKNGRCLGYEARPLICRLFGLVEKMRCPHGCEPARWIPEAEAHAMIAETEQLGGGLIIGKSILK